MKHVLNLSILFSFLLISNLSNAQLQVTCPDSLNFYVSDTLCTMDIEIPKPDVVDNCGQGVNYSIWGDFSAFENENINVGNYVAKVKTSDECGEDINCFFDIVVQDTTPPILDCLNFLTVEISNWNIGAAYAFEFDNGSTDNCGSIDFYFDENQVDDAQFFDCCDVGVHSYTIWGFDDSGNASTCDVLILVEDFLVPCSCDDYYITVNVVDRYGEGVEGVKFEIGNGGGFLPITNQHGFFSEAYYYGFDINLKPEKDEDFLDRVTTFDMVLIRKHILNVKKLDSPLKRLAADINNDEKITTLDLLEIRKLILHINQSFPNNTSWRFVKEEYEFPDPENPWLEPIPDSCFYENVFEDINQNFIGIKIGDVN